MNPKALVITGFGLNCEDETVYAFALAGAQADRVHLNDLLARPQALAQYHALAFIGGFSYGDHVAAGKVMANKFRYHLAEPLQEFIAAGKLIIGICNGFQSLVKLGVLPGLGGDYRTQSLTLTHNDSGKFEDRWVRLRVNPNSPCVFTRGIKEIELPVRHGEGKFLTADNSLLERLFAENLVAAQYADRKTGAPTQRYPDNPNGSPRAVAAICDPTGRIFGLMPHPEAYLSPFNHPTWTRRKTQGALPREGEGVRLFQNAVEFIRRELL